MGHNVREHLAPNFWEERGTLVEMRLKDISRKRATQLG